MRSPVALVEAAVDAVLRAFPAGPFLIAYSGGCDSRVLLDALVRRAGTDRVRALHVDHGLQAKSVEWARAAEAVFEVLGIGGRIVRLSSARARGANVEAWAREGRYAALRNEARHIGACAIVTAHHADDQVETLLLNLARGAGLAGLAAMPWRRADRDTARGEPASELIRPLLNLHRSTLEAYARVRGLRWIEDPSNSSTQMRRNALRHDVLPGLEAILPGFSRNAVRAVDRLREAASVLDELAARDLREALDRRGLLSQVELARLSPARRAYAFRSWLTSHGLRAPTESQLAEMLRQLVTGTAPHPCVGFRGWRICRYRQLIWAEPVPAPAPVVTGELRWSREYETALPEWGGALVARQGSGVPADWLTGQTLAIRAPRPGDRLRVRVDGPSRTLKNLFQEQGVPSVLRYELPVVEIGGQALFVSGLGQSRDRVWPAVENGVVLEFVGYRPYDARTKFDRH